MNLFFANKKPSVKPAGEVEAQPGNNETIESFVTAAEKVLAHELKMQADDYLNQAKGSEKNKWLDSIVSFWDKNKRSDIASFYFEKKAVALNNAVTWFKASDRYYYAIRFVKDQNE